MSTTISSLTIPAAYLEDMRTALLAQVKDDDEALRTAEPVERGPRAVILQRDTRLLAAVSDATADLELTAPSDTISSPLVEALETMVRQLTDRLARAGQFCPIPMGTVADVVEQLRWAAREAVRLQPSMNERLTANEWAVA